MGRCSVYVVLLHYLCEKARAVYIMYSLLHIVTDEARYPWSPRRIGLDPPPPNCDTIMLIRFSFRCSLTDM